MFASLALMAAAPAAATPAELAAACKGRDGLSDPAPPARIFGNVYDVGTCGIVVLLVKTPAGAVVVDAGPADAAPRVAANIRRLGLRLRDVRYLLSSHEHHDHAGGLAALQKATGATLLASAPARAVMESGRADSADPQAAIVTPFPRVKVARTIADGARVTLGDTTFTAHATPGHTAGSTTWTWRSCEGSRCLTVVFGDSLSAVSAPAYRFTDHPAWVARLRGSIARVGAVDCGLLVTPHPAVSHLYARFAGAEPLADPAGCRRYAASATHALDARLASERAK